MITITQVLIIVKTLRNRINSTLRSLIKAVVLIIHRTLSSVGVEVNIIIFIDIVSVMNRPLLVYIHLISSFLLAFGGMGANIVFAIVVFIVTVTGVNRPLLVQIHMISFVHLYYRPLVWMLI